MCDVGCIKYFVVRCNGIIGRPMYWAVRKGAAVGMRVRFCGPRRSQSWLFGRAERRKSAGRGEKTAKNGGIPEIPEKNWTSWTSPFPAVPRTALQGVARDPQRPTHRCRTPRRIAGDGTGDLRAQFMPLGRLTHQTCVEPPRASTAKAAAWAVKGAWGQRRSSSWAHFRVAHDRREAVHNTWVAAQGCTCLRSIEGGHGWSCLVSPPARAQNGSSRGLETDAKSYEG